jgi:DNA-directed RNA polymerase specialized sigma24 family protein
VQGFFALCLENNYLGGADESKGRFRSFLLTMFKRFLAKEWHKSTAQKRGGSTRLVELDALTAEQRYALEPAERLTAEQLYERRWALTLLDNVLNRLRHEQEEAGRVEVFDQLKETLTSTGRNTPYVELARRLGVSEAAIKVTVHRLRRRYRELLEQEIAHTVRTPEEIADERRHLLKALAG